MPSIMSSARILHCSVCDGKFGTRKEWLSHLLLPEHQEKARVECVGWGSGMKECVVVAYSSVQVADEEVLKYFCKDKDTMVTDFVWFPHRPRVGIIQFESRWKVNEMFSNSNASEVRIKNQLFQIKKGANFMNLEWMEMMPESSTVDNFNDAEAGSPDSTTAPTSTSKDKEKANQPTTLIKIDEAIIVKAISDNEKGKSSLESIKKYISDVYEVDVEKHEKAIKKAINKSVKNGTIIEKIKGTRKSYTFALPAESKRTKPERKRKVKEEQVSTSITTHLNRIEMNSGLLVEQFNEICREVEIPDDQYKTALVIMEKLEEIFKLSYPSCKLYMFRHWYLKMWTNGSNQLLFFVDSYDELSGNNQDRVQLQTVHRPKSEGLKEILLATDSQSKLPCQYIGRDGRNRMEGFIYSESGLKFGLTSSNSGRHLIETQTCRLLEYLCTFDSRAVPFFKIIHFWARMNNVKFGEEIKGEMKQFSVSIAREPAAMEWIITFFLCYKGIIPAPREALEQPHPLVTIFGNRDVGFSINEEFRKNWKSLSCSPDPCDSEEFILSILKLAQSFFSFCSNLKSRPWVLNMRDGELIHKKMLMVKGKNKLTDEEIGDLKSLRLSSRQWIFRGRLVLLHPLYFSNTFSFAQLSFVIQKSLYMKHTSEKLAKFLESKDEYFDVDFKLLFTVDTNLVTSEIDTLKRGQKRKLETEMLPEVNDGAINEGSRTQSKKMRSNDGMVSHKDGASLEPLECQFRDICRNVEIPDDHYKSALKIMDKLEQILNVKFPSCKVYMSRQWFLKLWSMGSNTLVFFVDDIDELAGNKQNRKRAGAMELKETILKTSHEILSYDNGDDQKMRFVDKKTGTRFLIISHPILMIETQTFRLLKYLCTFDSRALPFFKLIHYWSRLNKICLGHFKTETRYSAPEPSALQWLMISFLGSKRIVPTPREIIDRPHEHVFFSDFDIGFTEDEFFAAEWNADLRPPDDPNEFAWNILELVRDFFKFLLSLKSRALVVNTKDAELVPITCFYDIAKGENVDTSRVTKLTSEELSLLCKDYNEGLPLPRLKSSIVILHPIFWLSTFSFNTEDFFINITRFLQHSISKIDALLESRGGDKTDIDLKSTLTVDLKMKPLPSELKQK